MMYQALILDFDGVILESNQIKDDAFKHVFADHPLYLEEIMSYHHRSTGLIRFEKFRYISENIFHVPYTAELEREWGSSFSNYVLTRLAICPFVTGAQEFLAHFVTRVPLYIVSINPPQDLASTLQVRGLTRFFKKVYATTDKVSAIKGICSSENLKNDQVLFIGDTDSDHRSACAANVPFIGRQSGYWHKPQPFLVFNHLQEIEEHLCLKEK